jgi:hypothetical protein
MLTAFTRLRLVSDSRRPTMLVLRRRRSGDVQVTPSFGVGSFSLTEIEVQSATSRERKIKSRTEIRRADKIELKNVNLSRGKLFVFRIMEIKNIYRFSRESRELG